MNPGTASTNHRRDDAAYTEKSLVREVELSQDLPTLSARMSENRQGAEVVGGEACLLRCVSSARPRKISYKVDDRRSLRRAAARSGLGLVPPPCATRCTTTTSG
jgi:hypothetical protein